MLGLLTTALGLGGRAIGGILGTHVYAAIAKKTAIPAFRAIADGLGVRGIAGLVLGLYLSNSGFRAGIDQAVRAVLPGGN